MNFATENPAGKNQSSGQVQLDIAIVGSGIAGMSAAWLLSQAHSVTIRASD